MGLLAVGPGACAHQPCWVLEAAGQSSVLHGGLGSTRTSFFSSLKGSRDLMTWEDSRGIKMNEKVDTRS